MDLPYIDIEDDVSSYGSADMQELLVSFGAAPHQINKKRSSDMTEPTACSSIREGDDDSPKTTKDNNGGENNYNGDGSWHFDLGPLADPNNNKAQSPSSANNDKKNASSKLTQETLGLTEASEDDDMSLDIFGPGGGYVGNKYNRKGSGGQQQQQQQGSCHQSQHTMNSSVGVMGYNSVMSIPYSPNSKGAAAAAVGAGGGSDVLEERRMARAARMEKVRQRIAREKVEAQQRKERERLQAEAEFASDDARRQRAYEWYCKCGRLNRREMKRHIKGMGEKTCGVTEADVDLLPWNLTGSMVHAGKLAKKMNNSNSNK